ncbi:MAG: hypothetical protein AB1668_07265 [Nanoarchaeota archaeon]
MVVHYDNLDNIDDFDGLVDMLSDVRDFFLSKNVVFIFVGDKFFPVIVSTKKRVGQIFLTPALGVSPFSYEDIKKILEERVNQLRIDENVPLIPPHTEEVVKILFQLHEGNIREILNSLLSCVLSLQPSNTPIQIEEDILRDILFQKVNDRYMSKLTSVEREVLLKILEKGYITPTLLAELTRKTVQNISSKYIPKLIEIDAVRFKSAEGRNKFYEVAPEIKWWKLRRNEQEKMQTKISRDKKIVDLIQRSLREFI